MKRTPQEAMIELYTRELRLPALRQAYPELIKDAENGNESYQAFLSACLAHELEIRKSNLKQKRLKAARLPWIKSFGDYDFTANPKLPKQKLISLSSGSFVRDRENVICIGAAGTGKTHTLVACL